MSCYVYVRKLKLYKTERKNTAKLNIDYHPVNCVLPDESPAPVLPSDRSHPLSCVDLVDLFSISPDILLCCCNNYYRH